MNEAQMSILRMLSEGKISPDDAARLLDAIEPEVDSRAAARAQRRAQRVAARSPWSAGAADMSDEFFERAFDATPRQVTVGAETRVRVTNRMGSIHLVGVEGDTLRVEGAVQRSYELIQEGDDVTVRTRGLGAALTVYVPVTVAQLRAESDMGELRARELGGISEVQLLTHVGSVMLEIGEDTTDGRISVRSDLGSIMASVAPQARCEIRAATDQLGEVQNNADLEVLERNPGQLHAKRNGGGADVRLVTRIGAVMINEM